MFTKRPTRRSFIASSAGLAAATALPQMAAAQSFPTRPMQVVIPTGEGGGVDRAARAFTSAWSEYLGADFEFSYYPGASGQVGYEVFANRVEPDLYTLLFGNIAPEMMMYALQNPDFTYPDDVFYFASIDVDYSVIWVPETSPFQTIDDMIEEGRNRPITLSTSRLPHPSTVGALLLADEAGMEVRMIPYGGGSAARSAAITGEVDGCATFLSSSLSLGDQIRFLGVFNDENVAPELTNNALPFNEALGLSMPPLYGQRAWAVQQAAVEQYPERYETIQSTLKEVFENEAYRAAAEAAGTPTAFIQYNDREACRKTAEAMLELTERYRDILTG